MISASLFYKTVSMKLSWYLW